MAMKMAINKITKKTTKTIRSTYIINNQNYHESSYKLKDKDINN